MRYGSTGLTLLVICGFSVALVACGGGDDSGGSSGAGGTGAAPVCSGTGNYAAVAEIFHGPEGDDTNVGKCAAMSCHGGDSVGSAALNIGKGKNAATAMVNVASCENPSMPRVTPCDPNNSWLWIKLTADIQDTNAGLITYQGGTPGTGCGAIGFGTRMPNAVGTFDKLSDDKLQVIHDWIQAGAPGPT